MERVKLVVGLGNPGERFEKTRHNVGFVLARAFAEKRGMELKKDKKFHGWAAREEGIHVLLPATYMNESGVAVRRYCDFYQIGPSEVLVIADDAEIPFGSVRLRAQGSSGGHNGLKSVEAHLGTRNYPRLRIGVGRGVAQELDAHVLGNFTQQEWEEVTNRLDELVEGIELALVEPIEKVMSQINRSQT